MLISDKSLINFDHIPKNITTFFFGNEAHKASLSNYSIQGNFLASVWQLSGNFLGHVNSEKESNLMYIWRKGKTVSPFEDRAEIPVGGELYEY